MNKDNPADPAEWLMSAETQQGTWWTDGRHGWPNAAARPQPAPEQLGGGGLRPLVDAPGTYVFDS